MDHLITSLQTFFPREKLPGFEAQKQMLPFKTSKYIEIPKHAIPSAVMILLYPSNGYWHTCFIRRASKYEGDKHKGQISLPGGKFEESDLSLLNCAIRETQEEIGVGPYEYEILGQLSPLYVFVSGFVIHPFLAFLSQKPNFILDSSEVDYIIEYPVFELFESKKLRTLEIRGVKSSNSPYYDLNGEVLWGATAMIIAEFESIVGKAMNNK